MSRRSILIIYTGGTIGMYRNPSSGALSNFDFNRLVSYIPELGLLDYNLSSVTFNPPKDSSDMTPEDWIKIAQIISAEYNRYDGFVVLHGTDTMAYTASALSFMLENLSKPVVLTGSQLPVGALRTDGKENLLTAIEIAAAKNEEGGAMVPEVSIFFESRLMRGNRTTKINAERFNAFRSSNYHSLAHAGIHIKYEREFIRQIPKDVPLITHLKIDAHLVVLPLFPGIQPDMVSAMLNVNDLRAVILQTYGSGNAPKQPWLIRELAQLRERDIVVVNITQCSEGSVEMGRYATGVQLLEQGVAGGYDSTIECMVTKLMVLMGQGFYGDALRERLANPIAGEFSKG